MNPQRSNSVAPAAVQPCPGLKVTANAGVSFTDSLSRVHDLERARTLSPGEAAADPRMSGASVNEVLRLIRSGDLYPVFKRNERVIRIFDCALTDWRARQLTSQPLRHLALSRSQRVA